MQTAQLLARQRVMINDDHGDAAQPLARQRCATAQSKARRRRRLSVYGSPVLVLAQKAAFWGGDVAAGRQPGAKFTKKTFNFCRQGEEPTPPNPLARWVGPLTPLFQPQKETAAVAPGKQAQ